MNKITLLIIDDHPFFRQGVASAVTLESDMKVVGQASGGDEALGLIRSMKPTIVLLDVNLPGINGQQITRQVTQEKLSTRVVLVTGYPPGSKSKKNSPPPGAGSPRKASGVNSYAFGSASAV